MSASAELSLTDKERSTIVGALRLLQENRDRVPVDVQESDPLSDDAIDALVYYVNTGEHRI